MDEIKYLQDCVTLDEDLNFDTRYADDTTLIAAAFERLQLATDQLQEACKKYGMKINTEKCKVISDSNTNLTIENKEMEIVNEFKFLGSLVQMRIQKNYGHIGFLQSKNQTFEDTTLCKPLIYFLLDASSKPDYLSLYFSDPWLYIIPLTGPILDLCWV